MRVSTILFTGLFAVSVAACGSGATGDPVAAEDDIVKAISLKPAAVPQELADAIAIAGAEMSVEVLAETYSFDRARAGNAAKVVAALRKKLTHTALRVDEGVVDDATFNSTLEEYEVDNAAHRAAIIAATKKAIGAEVETRKFWLSSEDVPDATREWAQVDLFFVSLERQTAVRITLRYES